MLNIEKYEEELCQFLIGNVSTKVQVDTHVASTMCQFLIGNVSTNIMAKILVNDIEECQFLIGKVSTIVDAFASRTLNEKECQFLIGNVSTTVLMRLLHVHYTKNC